MKFTRIIGEIDPKLVASAEKALSAIFIELATRYDNYYVGTKLGGDPFIFSLIYPIEQVCTLNIPTAATDGKRYYWNPKFIVNQTRIGLRFICAHEAFHAIYMHPQRRGSRHPKLWNIAVDYIVNNAIMEDIKTRKQNPEELFKNNLGDYITLEQYAQFLKNPFSNHFKSHINSTSNSDKLSDPNDDVELTDKEKQEIKNRDKIYFYADPNLGDDMKSPEKIYDYLYSLLPKCPKCGSVGRYKLKNSSNKDKKNKSKSDKDKENKSDNHKCGNNCNHNPKSGECDECCGDFDIFGFGDTLDEHMDSSETEEKLAQRIADAIETAKKMAGNVPAALEEELGKLTAPKITWQDVVRSKLIKARAGHNRNDWTKFRTRPMFSGMLIPKRKSYCATFGCLLDTSGSMSKDDMAFGLSQLQSLDERYEGIIVPADAQIYWDKATKIKKASAEELCKVKVVGRGGTKYAEFFSDYKKKIGECDLLIVVTDGYLLDTDIAEMKNPGVDVIWIITSGHKFVAPFGRSFNLNNI
jgi:predicted metal-dependent peptidase